MKNQSDRYLYAEQMVGLFDGFLNFLFGILAKG